MLETLRSLEGNLLRSLLPSLFLPFFTHPAPSCGPFTPASRSPPPSPLLSQSANIFHLLPHVPLGWGSLGRGVGGRGPSAASTEAWQGPASHSLPPVTWTTDRWGLRRTGAGKWPRGRQEPHGPGLVYSGISGIDLRRCPPLGFLGEGPLPFLSHRVVLIMPILSMGSSAKVNVCVVLKTCIISL